MVSALRPRQPARLASGVALLFLAATAPSWSTPLSASIAHAIALAIRDADSGTLALAAFGRAGLYTLMDGFAVVGAWLATAGSFSSLRRQGAFVALALAVLLARDTLAAGGIPGSPVPHLMTVATITALLAHVPERQRTVWPTVGIVGHVLFAGQWLNAVSFLVPFGFGRDDLAVNLHLAAEFLGAEPLLAILAVALVVPLLASAVLYVQLAVGYAAQLKAAETIQRQARALHETKLQLLENRVYQELHTLVHDLKTPLVTVEGLASLLALASPCGRTRAYARRIEEAVQTLTTMINEILREDVRVDTRPHELVDLVRAHWLPPRDHIRLEVEVPPDLPPVRVNRIRMARVLMNLLENAMSAIGDRPGHIAIRAEAADGVVLLRIEDDGPGIPPHLLHEIDKPGFSTKQATGLGLPFVKKMVEAHGGTVTLTSTPGRGTTVCITLPCAPDTGTPAKRTTPS